MTRDESIRYVRTQAIAGRHLATCMADRKLREHGQRQVEQARRIARRLGYARLDLLTGGLL